MKVGAGEVGSSLADGQGESIKRKRKTAVESFVVDALDRRQGSETLHFSGKED